MCNYVKIVGAGLAGVEAAYFLANKGIKVKLYDIKPCSFTPAQNSSTLKPIGVIAPIPVTTTLLLIFLPSFQLYYYLFLNCHSAIYTNVFTINKTCSI